MATKEENLKTRYGITLSDFDHLARIHDYKCWICRESPATDIDHDHALSGLESVRGVLCRRCNVSLGYYQKGKLEEDSFWLKDHQFQVEVYLGEVV